MECRQRERRKHERAARIGAPPRGEKEARQPREVSCRKKETDGGSNLHFRFKQIPVIFRVQGVRAGVKENQR